MNCPICMNPLGTEQRICVVCRDEFAMTVKRQSDGRAHPYDAAAWGAKRARAADAAAFEKAYRVAPEWVKRSDGSVKLQSVSVVHDDRVFAEGLARIAREQLDAEAQAHKISAGTWCSVCKLPQWKSPGGDTCDNGHGGAPPLE